MKNLFLSLIFILLLVSCNPETRSVSDVIENLVTRLYSDMSEADLAALSSDKILSLLSEKDKDVLATKYWQFNVNTPVTVSIMRHIDQKTPPFWLELSGFSRTDRNWTCS